MYGQKINGGIIMEFKTLRKSKENVMENQKTQKILTVKRRKKSQKVGTNL